MDWVTAVQFLAGASPPPLKHHIQTNSGAYPASYPMGTGGSFPISEVAGA